MLAKLFSRRTAGNDWSMFLPVCHRLCILFSVKRDSRPSLLLPQRIPANVCSNRFPSVSRAIGRWVLHHTAPPAISNNRRQAHSDSPLQNKPPLWTIIPLFQLVQQLCKGSGQWTHRMMVIGCIGVSKSSSWHHQTGFKNRLAVLPAILAPASSGDRAHSTALQIIVQGRLPG